MKKTYLLIAAIILSSSVYATTITANFSDQEAILPEIWNGMNFGYAWHSCLLGIDTDGNGAIDSANPCSETRNNTLVRNIKDIRLDVHGELSTNATNFKNISNSTRENIQAHIDTVKWAWENNITVTYIIYPPSWLYASGPCTTGVETPSSNTTYHTYIRNFLNTVTQNGTYRGHLWLDTNEPDLFFCTNIASPSTQWNQLLVDYYNHTIIGAAGSQAWPMNVTGPSLCGGCETDANRQTIENVFVGNFSNNLSAVSGHPYPGSYSIDNTQPRPYFSARLTTLNNACLNASWSNCPIRITESGFNDLRTNTTGAPAQRTDPAFAYTQQVGIAEACAYHFPGRCSINWYTAYEWRPYGVGVDQFPRDWSIIPPTAMGGYKNAVTNFTLDFGIAHRGGHSLFNYTTNNSTVGAIVSGNSTHRAISIANYHLTQRALVNVTLVGATNTSNFTNLRNGTVYTVTGSSFLVSLNRNESAIILWNTTEEQIDNSSVYWGFPVSCRDLICFYSNFPSIIVNYIRPLSIYIQGAGNDRPASLICRGNGICS